MKFTVHLLCAALYISSAATAQDKPLDKAAIVDSFKQKIQDILKAENAAKGLEHATAISIEASPINAKKKMLHKDGTPCSAFHTGLCHYAWIDDSGAQYLNGAGKPCGGDTCVVWTRAYFATVSTYSFDVKQTDSLVTPYTGILTSTDVSGLPRGTQPGRKRNKMENFMLPQAIPPPLPTDTRIGSGIC